MKFRNCLVSLVVVSFLVGCARHSKYVGPANEESYDSEKIKESELIAVTGKFRDNSAFNFSPGSNGRYSVYYVLQLAAEDTLRNNKNYFSIYRPLAISDFEGNGLGSIEAFRDKCIIESTPKGVHPNFSAYSHGYCGTTQYLTSNLEIVEYADKPKDISSYKAQDVLDMVKVDGFYVEREDQNSIDNLGYFKRADMRGAGYGTWFASRRSDPREAD